MKTILITAYAVNPYKGSEDAMGWNMILQASRFNKVMAVTRKNNRRAIEQYMLCHPEMNEQFSQIIFLYFDWPRWSIGWKKGPLLSMIYYYCWQFTLAYWLKRHKHHHAADIVHNLNFHNDWTPTFLWILGKPMVWGHVGHHPKIPAGFIRPYGWSAYLQDRLLWMIKKLAWRFDPFLMIAKRKARMIICMNSAAVKVLRLKRNYIIHPSVAAHDRSPAKTTGENFSILSIGRFVPLKGFDLTIRSFAMFFYALPEEERSGVKLKLIGSGPLKTRLIQMMAEEGISNAVEIIEWIPRNQVDIHYRSASAFLFPSHEGAGMVVPEAMSYGLPVICMDNAGPGELTHPQSNLRIRYGQYGETIELMAIKLMNLYMRPEMRQKEADLSLARFNELFRWEIRGEMLRDVYDGLFTENKNDNS